MPHPIDDPALMEELHAGQGEEDLSVIIRVSDPEGLPPDVRVITRFGDIATARLPRARLQELADSPAISGLEASRNLRPSDDTEEPDLADVEEDPAAAPYRRRPEGLDVTGRGSVVAVLDWGLDFAHPAFRHADGRTRLLSLWDQRGSTAGGAGNRWGYGRIFGAEEINRALAAPDPYAALDYHPADAGARSGAHGTHVFDIAAGSGHGAGEAGVAPEADLVFVHLARTTDVLGAGNLGDSASVLEGLDYAFSTAGRRPCVVNLSVGAHGGPHDGTTLVELGIDQSVHLAPGRAVVNSAGNYRAKLAHTTGRVPAGGERLVSFRVPAHDTNDSEVELYYPHIDRLEVEVRGPTGAALARAAAGQSAQVVEGGRVVGQLHHQQRHGIGGDHHVDLLLWPHAPGGVWAFRLVGVTVHDGRYHGWIERDRGKQPTFLEEDVVLSSTTGTICNGRLSITVGCADPHRHPVTLARFSSGGPTRDGRMKPELVAPGTRIRAARSTPRGEPAGDRYTVKSGTSMAAPHVAGTLALMFEAAGRPLEVIDTRALLLGAADPDPFVAAADPGADLHRIGHGLLDIAAAVRAAREFGREGRPLAEVAEGSIPAPPPPVVPATAPSVGGTMRRTHRSPDPLPSPPALAGLPEPGDLRQLAWLASGGGGAVPFEPLSEPSGRLRADVRPGDLLLRRAPSGGGIYSAVVLSEAMESAAALRARGVAVEGAGAGAFVEVAELPLGTTPPRIVGRRVTDRYGRVPRYQALARPVAPEPAPPPPVVAEPVEPVEPAGLEESITVDDVAVEMAGLRCRMLVEHRATAPDGSVRTFASGSVVTIQDWNGTGPNATLDGFPVPKPLVDPEVTAVAGIRRYDVGLPGQRSAVARATTALATWLAREGEYRRNHDLWVRERDRLAGVVRAKEEVYSRMWLRQMMYNRFDVQIAHWTAHYNALLAPGTPLDPAIVKSMAYQESRMGTHGGHLMPPPSDWSSADRHPIRSRFNILQAVDSFGPQQWLMIREMAPAIFTRHGLDALIAGGRWFGMSNADYVRHATFMTALREFFTHRSGGSNLMGTPGRDLHEDYGFWIRTGIRWLFEKYGRLRPPGWPEAVRAYNGGGPDARAYRTRVLARVGSTDPFAADTAGIGQDEGEADTTLADSAPTLDTSARLEWEDLTRIPDSSGTPQLFYVLTGAPPGTAAVGDEGAAIFPLRVRNTNSVYNHLDVVTRIRLLDILPNRQFREVRPWTRKAGQELEDESSRVIPFRWGSDALRDAYDSESPQARIEVEYHWREVGEDRQARYNRAGLDFMLVAPIEFLLSQRRRLSPTDIPLNDRALHQDDYWLSLNGLEFTRDLAGPSTFQLELSSVLRQDTGVDQATTTSTTRSRTSTHTTSNTFNLQVTGEASGGSSAKATVEILELGLQRMFKLGASLGYSRTTTDTRSDTVAREFSRSLRLSRAYSASQGTTTRLTATVLPPATDPGPSGTGTRSRGGDTGTGVGLWLYPMVAFFEVPFVRFSAVNRLGQATRRSTGTVAMPFITGWRLTSRRD